ncbi:single-stranded DNA-binding protein [uncultured Tyzzerella sp.]|uniref:single-stranded DNA-binding protein n=1 Tax=uncultured Tyzzerella sp. TaxID=2321398 RepID=UPI0029428E7C|nr:single-stranded DNA-binding protein [uncultured Tyzzerella sp.]
MNNISLIGRLAIDPKISIINVKGVDKTIAKYTLAVERMGSNDVDFILCSVLDKGAEWVKNNVKKGSRIGVIGSLKINTYEKYGMKINSAEILVREQYFA